jgi:hypothetical protein
MSSRAFSLLLGLLTTGAGGPVDQRDEFLARIHKIYDFEPSKLSIEEREQKSKELDAFWKEVEEDKEKLLPALREALRSDKTSAFFHFDGAQVLIVASPEPADFQLAADAIARADLKDIQQEVYFRFTHHLATRGADVTTAVGKILDSPGFEAFIPQHVLTLDQARCAVYCILPMRDDLYSDQLIARLLKEKDPKATKSILLCLSSTVTEKARKALREFSSSTTDKELKVLAERGAAYEKDRPPAAKVSARRELLFKFLEDYLERRDEDPSYDFATYEKEAPYLVRKEDYARIKELRRKHSARVSDEALEEIAYLTRLMRITFTADK